jgi:hypothetical protein
MPNDLTWVIDFRNSKEKQAYSEILSSWCKIHKIEELISEEFSEEKVKEYFDNYMYRDILKEYLYDAKVVLKINVVLIADNEKINNASLFAYYLRKDQRFKVNIGLENSASINCHLCTYFDSSWSKEEEQNRINDLYALNLFQNITDLKFRPFDFAFVFKEKNSGLGQNEYRSRPSEEKYFDTKISALIFHISCQDNDLLNQLAKKNGKNWCVSFGANHIYFNAQELYAKSAKELTDLLVQELIQKENDPWELQKNQSIDESLKELESGEVFKAVKYKHSPSQAYVKTEFYKQDFSPLWDWFGLKKMHSFFTSSLKEILYNLKSGKVDFLFKEYNLMRSEVGKNYNQFSDFSSSNVRTAEAIFDEYFRYKPFSFQAYRKGLLELIAEIEKRKMENKDAYHKGYLDPELPYSPCSMSPSVLDKYSELVTEYNDKTDFLISDITNNQVLSLKEKAENTPHPVSLLLKTTVLSSVIVLLAYIPLSNLLENNLLTFGSLFVMFVLPYVFMWSRFKKNADKLADLCDEYEAWSKYNVTRKLNEYIYRKIDEVYDTYLEECKRELSLIEKKLQAAQDFLKQKTERDHNLVSTLSIKNANDMAEYIPAIKIEINGEPFETEALKDNITKLFQYFKQTIQKDSISLHQLLTKDFNYLMDIIVRQLKDSTDNMSSAADLLFPALDVNMKNDAKEEFLNLLPPYNNGNPSVDQIYSEIIVDSYKLDGDAKILGFLDPKLNPCIVRSQSTNSTALNFGYISALTINQPTLNLFDLFSTSLGGNSVSFIKHTENFVKHRKDQFLDVLRKLIMEEIILTKTETTEKRDIIFKAVMKGFDTNFDENTWQLYITELSNITNPFIKEFRELFNNEFDSQLREYLISNMNK